MNYTINGIEYSLLIQDGDIHLESLDHDLIFPQGFAKCQDSARDYCKGMRDTFGETIGYSESQVYDIALDYIADYVKSEPYTILKHENN